MQDAMRLISVVIVQSTATAMVMAMVEKRNASIAKIYFHRKVYAAMNLRVLRDKSEIMMLGRWAEDQGKNQEKNQTSVTKIQ